MQITLKQLSVCQCGFPTLDEGIPLGTIYNIIPDRMCEAELQCGGCGAVIPVIAVWVEREGHGGYLPRQIFEPSN